MLWEQIDAFPLHHITESRVTSALSPTELQYIQQHHALLAAHYGASFLSQFPPALQKLDDRTGGLSMVDAPDEQTAVFCRVLRDVGVVSVPGTDAAFEMNRGDVFVVRWSVIRSAVEVGDVELI
jgi:GINS complex subunit 4